MSDTTTDPGRTGQSTVRDRVTDAVLVALAGVMVLVTWAFYGEAPVWLLTADVAVGALGAVALWWRRRFPVVLGLVVAVLSVFSETVAGAATIALFTVAVHRSPRATAVVCVTSIAALSTHQLLWPDPSIPPLTLYVILALGHLATVAWGLTVRSRRALVRSLRDRAVAAETEARLRAERSEAEARETLARDMHDALGHRLSLLSVHAGALTYARDAPADDVARAAEVVRENAHRALQDLREVIGVLRAPVGESPVAAVEDVLELVDEARQAGTPVELRDEAGLTTGAGRVTASQGHTVYRVVQESLTNARKHAPGAPVVVRITGRRGDHLVTEVTNASTSGPPAYPGTAGAGAGLTGLVERARLVDGQLDHGPTGSGGWRVRLRLPWPS